MNELESSGIHYSYQVLYCHDLVNAQEFCLFVDHILIIYEVATGLKFIKIDYFTTRKVPQILPFRANINFSNLKLKLSTYFIL